MNSSLRVWLGAKKRRMKNIVGLPRQKTSSPPPPPPGHVIGAPDFVGIGAQKSGTSWWYHVLTAHQGVYHPSWMDKYVHPSYLNKERHFFDSFAERSWDPSHIEEYHAWFPRPADTITGEWTPRYLCDFWTPPLLKQAAPEARILVMLRDPVQRFFSGLQHSQRGSERLTLDKFNEHAARGLYSQGLHYWLNWFDPAQILVLQYERCIADPMPQLVRTCNFLGLDTTSLKACEKRFGLRINAGLPKSVSLKSHLVEPLREYYRADILSLVESFPSIDPTLWLESR